MGLLTARVESTLLVYPVSSVSFVVIKSVLHRRSNCHFAPLIPVADLLIRTAILLGCLSSKCSLRHLDPISKAILLGT